MFGSADRYDWQARLSLNVDRAGDVLDGGQRTGRLQEHNRIELFPDHIERVKHDINRSSTIGRKGAGTTERTLSAPCSRRIGNSRVIGRTHDARPWTEHASGRATEPRRATDERDPADLEHVFSRQPLRATPGKNVL